MNLSWAGGWQAVTIAVALIVGGAAIMAPQAEQSAHLFRWLGYGFLVAGCLVFVASMFLLHRMSRRRCMARSPGWGRPRFGRHRGMAYDGGQQIEASAIRARRFGLGAHAAREQ